MSDYVAKAHLPKLTESQKFLCDTPITEIECKLAMNQLYTNKSPGLDGFSIEFYKTFREEIKEPFFESIDFSVINGKLTETQYQGVITLIPKAGKDHLLACNYRPITLLNCDYKIISKVINNRLLKLLPNLIGNEQNGFVKGRYIG